MGVTTQAGNITASLYNVLSRDPSSPFLEGIVHDCYLHATASIVVPTYLLVVGTAMPNLCCDDTRMCTETAEEDVPSILRRDHKQ